MFIHKDISTAVAYYDTNKIIFNAACVFIREAELAAFH